jgi:hypothetical protein
MYKVLKIEKYQVTSSLSLLNIETKTREDVFNDSDVVDISWNCVEFNDFMKEGELYECKITLFGKFVPDEDNSAIEVVLDNLDVLIGDTHFIKVHINSDNYYILKSDADGMELREKMNYKVSRKDLIQVSNVIHGKLFKHK